MSTSSLPSSAPLAPTDRVVSLDALRGFDMFWILGADALIHAIGETNHSRFMNVLVEQTDHRNWEGFAFYDLIFPMFVFIVGVSLVFSLSKTISISGTAAAVRRIIFRSILLYLLGILYYGGMANEWPKIRLVGVLQRIALCYLVAGLLFTFFKPRTLAIVTVSLLLLYWGLMALVPVPGVGRGNFAERMNLSDYIDKVALPGKKWNKDHDPEGLLSTLPAIASCLLGVFAGLLLRNDRVQPWKKAGILLMAGAASVALGMAWGGMFPAVPHLEFLSRLRFPVIKKIWTSSFVLVAAGYSAALLGLFYLVIDVWKLQFWARPFVWIGMNAITLYMLEALFSFPKLANRFVGGNAAHALGQYSEIARTGVTLLLVLLLARFLYRRAIFLRL
jgi:predicted acyltransferase